MSERIARRLDRIIAYGRWLALLGILPVVLIDLSFEPNSPAWTILIITAVLAVLDMAPVAMLYFKYFPDWAALTFVILDSIYALLVLYLGGVGMFFYCFVPVITTSVRFDWTMGLINAGVLAVGHTLFALVAAQLENVGEVLPPALFQSMGLLVVSLLCGFLSKHLKEDPPPDSDQMIKINQEIKRLRAAADRSRAIHDMARTLGATLNADKILDAVLEISTVGFEELSGEQVSLRERPASAVFLFGGDGMYIAASSNISYEEADTFITGEQGALYRVMSQAEPKILGNLANDPELKKFTPFRLCRSAICVPLRAGFELYGAVLFASPKTKAFGEDHIELLSAVAAQAAIALNNAQLYQDIQSEKEKILEVVEEERNKLARDLHDGPTQSISAIAMRLNFSRLLLDREPDKVKDELFKLENLARRTTKEIRTMLFTLRPVVLETQGLKVAVEQLVEKLQDTGDLPVTLEIEDIEDQMDVNLKAVAWFITEEALNNAKKHANAETIWVRMGIRDEHFVVEIEDDGDGFDYEATMATYDQRGSFGLLNYKERADLVNGRSVVRSALGKGTKVSLIVPLHQEVI